VDAGLSGVTVSAYDAGGVLRGSTTTAADGTYTLAAAGTGPYRIEFTNLPAGFLPSSYSKNSVYNGGNAGTADSSGSLVQFVPDGNTANVNLAVNRPADYCQNNPEVCAVLYNFGTNNGTAVFSVPYNAGSTRTTGGTPTTDFVAPSQQVLATTDEVGTVYGTAYSRFSRRVYVSAFMKKHAAFGPAGTGAIYQIDRNANNEVSLYADLNAIFGANTAGSNPHDVNNYDRDNDNITWDAVGKVAFGGMDVSADETRLYAMNLANRTLYELPLNAAPTAANIRSVAFPSTMPNCTNSADVRPFAVHFYENQLYVGAVCSAESSQNAANLRAYVYQVNPTTLTFNATPIFQTALNYPRAEIDPNAPAEWLSWSPTFANLPIQGNISYPQPILSGIAFDNGNLILALRDRLGEQAELNALSIPGSTQRRKGITGGDILRACGSISSGFTLESNGRCGGLGSAPQGTGEGPGNGEYYYQDSYKPNGTPHDEVAVGGVLQIPGYRDLMATVFDPTYVPNDNIFDVGGFRWFRNTDGTTAGAQNRGYLAYLASASFGKSNGIGGTMRGLCDSAPLQIGNRIWLDANADGVQSANGLSGGTEAGIAGVAVQLWEDTNGDGAADTLVSTVNTDANGEYYFGNSSCQETTVAVRVASSTDDAEQTGTTVNTSDSSLNLGFNGALVTPAANIVGLRYGNLNIPQGATITSANIQFTADNLVPSATNVANVFVRGQAIGEAPAFNAATANDISNRTRTSAGITWSNIAGWGLNEAGANQRTPDLSSIVQEIVNRSGWSPNNGLAFILENNQSTNNSTRSGYSFDLNPNNAPLLTVTYKSNCGYQVKPNTRYEIRIPATNFSSGQPLNNRFLTTSNAAAQAGLVDGSDSDAANVVTPLNSPAGAIPVVYLTTGGAGANNHNFDIGFAPTAPAAGGTYSLGNRVWFDTNNNGRIDAGEAGINGVSVSVFADTNADGVPDGAALATQATANGGYYRFDGLNAGNYVVRVNPANFTGVLAGYRNTSATISADLDSDAASGGEDGINTTGALNTVQTNGILSRTITLGNGASEPTGETDLFGGQGALVDGFANMTVDFGFYQLSVSGRVWIDPNDNGNLEAGENGRNNVPAQIFDNNGVEIPVGRDGVLGTADDAPGGMITSGTGANAGSYSFRGLQPGTYTIRIVPVGTTRSSLNLAPAADPNNNIRNDDNGAPGTGPLANRIFSPAFTLTPGFNGAANNNTVNNANGSTLDPTIDFGLFGPATSATVGISGRVLTALGRGVFGARVTIESQNGESRTAITNPFGYYRFDNVTSGQSYVFSVKDKRHSFVPQVITVNEATTEFNFTAQK
jgi:hypothetical protein